MIYSGIFSAEKNNHPIPSFHNRLTGEKTISTGLSRSFSEIVRGNFSKAKEYNPYCFKIFAFFVIQFFLRIFVILLLNRNNLKFNTIRNIDIFLSILLFIICFRDFIMYYK
ncbi:MAG: DUF2752 domain-containing protein [Bacteroidales bacterium]|nr:DUF2752 domain-containing protein [Bacteroidales bacterium]